MQTLSRRGLLRGSIAAGLSAATSVCAQHGGPSESVPPYTVNFICGGMLAYHVEWSKGRYSFRILIPEPVDAGQLAHLVRFGGVGGDPLDRGHYRLELPGHVEPVGDPFPGGQYKTDMIFGRDDMGNQTEPWLKANTGQMFAQIVLPKPSAVQRARLIQKLPGEQSMKFFSGDGKDFNINPDTIPGVYILTYSNVTGPVRLVGVAGTSSRPRTFAPQPIVLNIHLYSERPYGSEPMDHIHLFNAMFTRSDTGQTLNLTHDKTNAQGQLTCIADEDPGLQWSRWDIATLYELGVGKDKPAPPPGCIHQAIGDPAGCSDAWVYAPFRKK
jgi:hypothetical protein